MEKEHSLESDNKIKKEPEDLDSSAIFCDPGLVIKDETLEKEFIKEEPYFHVEGKPKNLNDSTIISEEASIKSGAGADQVYKPNLWYSEKLMFLRDQEEAKPSRTSMVDEEREIDTNIRTRPCMIESQMFFGKNPCIIPPSDSSDISEESIPNNELVFNFESDELEEVAVEEVKPDKENSQREKGQPSTSSNSKRPIWRRGNSESMNRFEWKGSVKKSARAKSPIEYFRYYFDQSILEEITHQSNLYSLQNNPFKSLQLTVSELEQFLGTVLYMSCASLPNARLHWSKIYKNSNVADVMSRDRWEEIKSNIHFSDNNDQPSRNDPQFDRLYKVRPVVKHLQRKVQRPPNCEYMCLDEQIVPCKGNRSCKQKKTKKCGYKIFVLTDDKGIVYNFDIYCGQIGKVNGFSDIGASGNIVLKLVEVVPRKKNYKLFFDKWFTSISLVCELDKIGIQTLGTVHPNRLTNLKLPSDKDMKKRGRGNCEERSALINGTHVRAVKYFDKRSLLFLTTYATVDPCIEKVKYDAKQKAKIPIQVPAIVHLYNSHMGGVDRLDQMISLYRCNIRSKKFYHKIFFYLIDMICASSWQEYREDCREGGIKDSLCLLDFKTEIAEALCKEGKLTSKKRGRTSTSTVEIEFLVKKKKGPAHAIPNTCVRLDQVGHLPMYKEKKGRCKFPGCKGITKVACIKCKCNLCFTSGNNCFLKFHTE